MCWFFFFNDTATPEIYPLSLHDPLPISKRSPAIFRVRRVLPAPPAPVRVSRRVIESNRLTSSISRSRPTKLVREAGRRSEEHTSELQSRQYLVCRLLLEKKKKSAYKHHT